MLEDELKAIVSIPYRYGTTYNMDFDADLFFSKCQFLIGMVRRGEKEENYDVGRSVNSL